MRALPVAVAVSAAVHALALVYVETRPHPKHQPPPQVTAIEVVPAAPAEPMVVQLLDDHTPVNSLPATALPSQPSHPATGGASSAGHHRGGGAISTGVHGTETAPGNGGHSPMMGMRGKNEGPGLVWTPSDKFNQAFDAYSAAHPPDIPPPPSGELKPSGNGTYRSDEPAFTVRTERDGTAHIEDKPDVGDFHIGPGGITGRMGFDDWAMRKAGIDPYASAKRQWLDKTRDERARIGMANRKEDLARAPEFMRRNVAWAMEHASSVDEKKEALFELWDDCAETGDDALVEAGANARRYVVGFIRAHLPAGKPGGYTPEELAQLNAHRRSKATFKPY
jgi:hypothetical protein